MSIFVRIGPMEMAVLAGEEDVVVAAGASLLLESDTDETAFLLLESDTDSTASLLLESDTG